MNGLSYCLALYQTWEIPQFPGLLLRWLCFPESCPATVRLPEIFASRRQAVLLIPSALHWSRSPDDHHPQICNSGGLQTLTPILNTICTKKSSNIFYNILRKLPVTALILWLFQNFLAKKFVSFCLFCRIREFFIGYIDTLFAFMIKIYQSFLHFTQIDSDMSITENGKAAGKPAAFGGNMWESNPPGRLLAPLNGFEDRGAHQHPSTPMGFGIVAQLFSKSKPFFRNYSRNPRCRYRRSPSFLVILFLS